MALSLDIAVGEELRVGDSAVIVLVQKSGRRARLRITGSAEVELVKVGARDEPCPKEPDDDSGN